MEKQMVITSGRKYIDIDAYAGMFAYKKLLQSLGYEVYVATLTKGVSEVKTLNVSQSKFSAAKEEYVLYQGGI